MLFQNLAADPAIYNMLEGTWKIDVTQDNGNVKQFVNVLHFRRITGSTPPNMTTLVTSLDTNGLAMVLVNVNVNALWNSSSLRPLDDPLNPGIVYAVNTGNPGGQTGDRYDSFSAAKLSLNTGIRGKSFRGSKHFGPLSESDAAGDDLNAGAITNWTNTAVAIFGSPFILSDGTGNTFQCCVLSTLLSKLTPPSIQFTGADVLSATLNHTIGTMRRRKEKP